MHAPVHLAVSWLTCHTLPERRDRRLVTWAGVAPDLDALSLFAGTAAYSQYHHVLTHEILMAVFGTALWTALAKRRLQVLIGSLITFHLHLLCDLFGSGRDWAIVYWFPFSRREFMSPYGWPLASPQNGLIWLAAVAATIWIALKRGRTFGEAFLPARADAAVVSTLRKLFRREGQAHPSS